MAGKYSARNDSGHHVIAQDDPIALHVLKQEHHRFRELFDAAEASDGEERAAIARELCMRLGVHMTIEEELLYPALKSVIGADEINEGIVEHAAGKVLMAEIENLSGDEELYEAKVHVLGEETIHHIDEEDEELFEYAKQAHRDGKVDLDELGRTLEARQAELYANLEQFGDEGDTHEAVAEEIPAA
ncbi:hemerythrin domain-containing protein [uncultured Sphingomonas sp.]|uniref:hemerythrin domain-containing protein n=1 Tax=uncultured Sphingomonas sp. TaxID=158754 RepID=UPI0025F368FA|nr:hemerythrin domain-containing protein [uncultured Sphingomonas sp.]